MLEVTVKTVWEIRGVRAGEEREGYGGKDLQKRNERVRG